MVSFWPFGGDDQSAAGFEKALSQLTAKINTASAQHDKFRHRQRKYKALFTIYILFGYILVTIILLLVTGWQNWGLVEYTCVSGGPLLIYVVRQALHSYYGYRITGAENHLKDLHQQREETLEKLKASTKYNSTQQLLEKYGGSPNSKRLEPAAHEQRKRQKSDNGQPKAATPATPPPGRTGMRPPPTANIPSRPTPAMPRMADGEQARGQVPPAPSSSGRAVDVPGEEFAPNAFSTAPAAAARPPMISQPSQTYAADGGPRWYDRLMDVILGDDETQAKNRIVLLCAHCRLVNGQAPPGARTLEEIGRWRCSACHAWNGVEPEEKTILQQMARRPEGGFAPSPRTVPVETGSTAKAGLGEEEFEHVEKYSREEGEEDEKEEEKEDDEARESQPIESVDAPPAESTRSKARQRRKV